MKEMLGAYADGQIEFYKAVRGLEPATNMKADAAFSVGHGGVG